MPRSATCKTKHLAGPPCEKCGGPTRLIGIAPHRRFKRRHVWTLECRTCGAASTVEMPLPRSTH